MVLSYNMKFSGYMETSYFQDIKLIINVKKY